MSTRVNVASEWKISYTEMPITPDEFDKYLGVIYAIDPNVIFWMNSSFESSDSFQFDCGILHNIAQDKNTPADVADFCKKLIELGDPSVDVIKVDLF